jgi:hypothetical protein
MNTTLDIKGIFSLSFKKLKEHLAFLILTTLGFLIITLIIDKLDKSADGNPLLIIANIALGVFSMFTFVRVGLRLIKGESFVAKDIFNFDWHLLGLYALGSLLFTLAYLAGFVLLIIPGIFLAIRLGLFGFIIIDEHKKPVDALKKSFAMTEGHFWKLLGFALILGIINFLGALLFGVGMLVTAPFTLLATAYLYEKLKSFPLKVTPVDVPVQNS